ncbi:DUF1223 domain-containing protein [Falsirhodobacter deserti]|uniref:DUF1223 domain-containing protein n=1 Tax=Falsirhodobacter deserti TaxID=1365611 RepID=UPI000FE429D5|nr:DUF1223 domain-containing protein [Falsirhodobacter deserti]
MQRVFGTICGLGIGLAGGAWAQSTPVVVVELFTSQGCSACPPADGQLAELADDPRVIALALHVDYWDYIGWKDRFGQPAFTQRQKAYARAAGSRMLYTPQFIIDGSERVEGNQPDRVRSLVRAHTAAVSSPQLTLDRMGEAVTIKAPAAALAAPVTVQVVRYHPSMTIDIETGENAGRTIAYRNIVTSWQTLQDWTGEEPLEMTVPATGEDEFVVILQEPGPGSIVAAAQLN